MTRKTIPKFTKSALMNLPEGVWLISNKGELNSSGTIIPIVVVQIPGINDTELRDDIWSQNKDNISGRVAHYFDNEFEMSNFVRGWGVEP